MMNRLRDNLKNFWKRSRMTEYECFLHDATDIADLEHRMKYGFRYKNYATPLDNISNSNLFYVRGF